MNELHRKMSNIRNQARWELVRRHIEEYEELIEEMYKAEGLTRRVKLNAKTRILIDKYMEMNYSDTEIQHLLLESHNVNVSLSAINRYTNGVSFKNE